MKRLGFLGACVALDAAMAAFAHARLPERVPIHWGADGQPDGFGPRAVLTVGGFALTVAVAGLLAYLRDRGALPSAEVHDASPGSSRDAERAERGIDARDVIEHTSIVMTVAIHAAALAAASGLLSDIRLGIAAAFSVFCLVGGNAMGRVRPNRYVGVRTRSTLSSPRIWRRTHRLAGRLLVAAGIVCFAVALLWPTTAGFAVAFGIFVACSIAPVPYAWWLAQQPHDDAGDDDERGGD